MPAGNKTITIDRYDITHYVCGNDKICHIGCYSLGYPVGLICFYPIGQVTKSIMNQDQFVLGFEIGRYQEIIETFRYEKLVYVKLYWDNNKCITLGLITTGIEHVGEQEGV